MLNKQVFLKGKACAFAIVLAGVSGWLPAARAGNDDLRYEACPKCEPKQLAWTSGLYNQIHLVPGQHQNAQPQALNVVPLSILLNKINIQSGSRMIPLLDEEAARELAGGLVEAMKKATPQDDALFFITSRGSSGIMSGRNGSSGIAFIDEKGLNLIFGEANVDFFGTYKATRVVRPFYFGSRSQASRVLLRGDGLSITRGDTVLIPLGASSAPPPIPLTVGGTAAPQGVGEFAPAAAAAAAAVVAPAPATIFAPAPAPAPAPGVTRNEQYYQAQEMRLKTLKRLFEQGLITEEEYKTKRNEILKDL